MTLNLHLLYFVWTEEYCQTSPNKNKSPNLWQVTSILVCCIFVSELLRIICALILKIRNLKKFSICYLLQSLDSKFLSSMHNFKDFKGQIISECPYEIFVYPKIATKKFPRFLPWPLRRGQIKNFIKPIKLNNP